VTGFFDCPAAQAEGYTCPENVSLSSETDLIEMTSGEAFSEKVKEKLFNSISTYGPYQSCKVEITATGEGIYTW